MQRASELLHQVGRLRAPYTRTVVMRNRGLQYMRCMMHVLNAS